MLPLRSTVTVSADLVEFFATADARGQGGWQSLLRRLKRDLEQSSQLTLTSVDLKRIVRYIGAYGTGGYQRRLRQLLQQWADQHHFPPKKTRTLDADEKRLARALNPATAGTFSRTHYQILGEVLANERDRSAVERIATQLATVFADDSPRFNTKRWRVLCGLLLV